MFPSPTSSRTISVGSLCWGWASSSRWPWSAQPVIHEVDTWVWLTELAHRYQRPVTLADVPVEAWDEVTLPAGRLRVLELDGLRVARVLLLPAETAGAADGPQA